MAAKDKAAAKSKGGQPTKYNSMMLAKAQHYLDNYRELGDTVPTVVGVALALDVATNTIYNWVKAEVSTEFLSIFTRIEQTQCRDLINNGLNGQFNPAITKMMLTKHGYSDKQEVDHSSRDGSMSPKGRSLDDFYEDAGVPVKSGAS